MFTVFIVGVDELLFSGSPFSTTLWFHFSRVDHRQLFLLIESVYESLESHESFVLLIHVSCKVVNFPIFQNVHITDTFHKLLVGNVSIFILIKFLKESFELWVHFVLVDLFQRLLCGFEIVAMLVIIGVVFWWRDSYLSFYSLLAYQFVLFDDKFLC